MAGENRGPSVNLKKQLLKKGETFAFFQALRLIRFFLVREKGLERGQDPIKEFVRIRPHLSLAHPPTEIEHIEELPGETPAYLMTANFLGLYGESSPLPSFYTEDLLDEPPENESATRDFYAILNYPLYLLFNQIWTKYRPFLKVVDENDAKYLEILFSLLGLGVNNITDDVPDSYRLPRYIGLFTQTPKSALGLKILLSDALKEPRLEIMPCIKRTVRIPADQRCFLGKSGNLLGKESYLGETIADRTRKFRIRIGPLNEKKFRKLMPGTDSHARIKFLSRFYLLDPFESELELRLDPEEVKTARLGGETWNRLGLDTWVFSGDYKQDAKMTMQLQ